MCWLVLFLFVLVLEVVGQSKRSLFSNLYSVVWAVFYMVVAGIAYLFRDRLIFMIVASAPSVLILVPLWYVKLYSYLINEYNIMN